MKNVGPSFPSSEKKNVTAATAMQEVLLALVLGCAVLAFGLVAYLTWFSDGSLFGSPPAVSAALPTKVAGGVPGFTLVRLSSRDGKLITQLATEAQKAQSLGQAPFVEFDAEW